MKVNKTTLAFGFLFSALLVSLLFSFSQKGTSLAARESVYERIMKNRTVRCAYQIWPPYTIKDPNTGKLSGVYFDLIEKMGHDLSLKIDWAEEVGSANMFEGFATGRYDLFCTPLTPTPERSLVSSFSRPVGYLPMYLYVREGDIRFDHAYEKVNDHQISIISMDGDFTAVVGQEEFPKAKKISLPNMTNGADLLMSVAGGKADAAVNDPTIAGLFIKNNPGKIRQVQGEPIRFPSITMALPLGEEKLLDLINNTLTYYLETGAVDRILNSYGIDKTKLLRVARPYQKAQNKKGEE